MTKSITMKLSKLEKVIGMYMYFDWICEKGSYTCKHLIFQL